MKVSDILLSFKNQENYVNNSLYLKSVNIEGCVYKFLIDNRGFGMRKEFFIALNPEESGLSLEEKTAVNSIEIYPAR